MLCVIQPALIIQTSHPAKVKIWPSSNTYLLPWKGLHWS